MQKIAEENLGDSCTSVLLVCKMFKKRIAANQTEHVSMAHVHMVGQEAWALPYRLVGTIEKILDKNDQICVLEK